MIPDRDTATGRKVSVLTTRGYRSNTTKIPIRGNSKRDSPFHTSESHSLRSSTRLAYPKKHQVGEFTKANWDRSRPFYEALRNRKNDAGLVEGVVCFSRNSKRTEGEERCFSGWRAVGLSDAVEGGESGEGVGTIQSHINTTIPADDDTALGVSTSELRHLVFVMRTDLFEKLIKIAEARALDFARVLPTGFRGVNGDKFPVHYLVLWSLDETFNEIRSHLREKPSDVNTQDDDGNTPLHILVLRNRSTDQVDKFLALPGLDIAIANNNGTTAIHLATLIDNTPALEALVFVAKHDRAKNIISQDKQGNSPFHYAAIHANDKSLLLLMSYVNFQWLYFGYDEAIDASFSGARVQRHCAITSTNNLGRSCLHFAAICLGLGLGNSPWIFDLLTKRAREDNRWASDWLGRSFLHYLVIHTIHNTEASGHSHESALEGGAASTLRQLRFIRKGIPPCYILATDRFGKSSLDYAFENVDIYGTEDLRDLLQFAESPSYIGSARVFDTRRREPFLHHAIRNDTNATAWRRTRTLLESKFSLAFMEQLNDVSGQSIFHVLGSTDLRLVPKTVLDRILSEASRSNHNFDHRDNLGFTPIHLSLLWGSFGCFWTTLLNLIRSGLFRPTTLSGPLMETPIHIAARLLERPVELKAVIDTMCEEEERKLVFGIKNKLGETPAITAFRSGMFRAWSIGDIRWIHEFLSADFLNYDSRQRANSEFTPGPLRELKKLLTYSTTWYTTITRYTNAIAVLWVSTRLRFPPAYRGPISNSTVQVSEHQLEDLKAGLEKASYYASNRRELYWMKVQTSIETISPLPVAWWPFRPPTERERGCMEVLEGLFGQTYRRPWCELNSTDVAKFAPDEVELPLPWIPFVYYNVFKGAIDASKAPQIRIEFSQQTDSDSDHDSAPAHVTSQASNPTNAGTIQIQSSVSAPASAAPQSVAGNQGGHGNSGSSGQQHLGSSQINGTNSQAYPPPRSTPVAPAPGIGVAAPSQNGKKNQHLYLLLCLDIVELTITLRYHRRCILSHVSLEGDEVDGGLFSKIRGIYYENAGFWRWKRILSMHGLAEINLVKFRLLAKDHVKVTHTHTSSAKLDIPASTSYEHRPCDSPYGSLEMMQLFKQASHTADSRDCYFETPKLKGSKLVYDSSGKVEVVGYGLHLVEGVCFRKILIISILIFITSVVTAVVISWASKDIGKGCGLAALVIAVIPIFVTLATMLGSRDKRG